jgi:hypothetical protein
MSNLDLSQVGNVREDYKHRPMTVRFHDLVSYPSLNSFRSQEDII